MRFEAPFKLGPFLIDAEGRVSPREPSAFLFRWRRRIVRARLDHTAAGSGQLTFQVTLARVPSTAGTRDQTLRPRSFALLHWAERTVPPAWRVALLPDHRIWLETCTRIVLPVTIANLLTEISSFTLDLAPYLELMDEIGLTLPAA